MYTVQQQIIAVCEATHDENISAILGLCKFYSHPVVLLTMNCSIDTEVNQI